MRASRIAAVIGINLGLIVIGAALLEWGFGTWSLRQRLIPGINLYRDISLVFKEDLYPPFGQETLYRRDYYGFRGRYRSVESLDFLTLGGSTTDQRYVTEGATWQDVLQDEFARAGRKVS